MSRGEVGFFIIIMSAYLFLFFPYILIQYKLVPKLKPKYKTTNWLEWTKKNNHLFIPLEESLKRKEVQNTDGDGI